MTFPEILATYITIDDDIRSFLNTQTEKNFCEKGNRYQRPKHFKPHGVFCRKRASALVLF